VSPKGIEAVLSRAMRDVAFANLLFSDPEKALSGFELSDEEISKLRSMKREDFESALAAGSRISKDSNLRGNTST
jgi:hypothetical protein